MIKAKATLKGDRPLYLFGLSARNIELLRQGQPIRVDLEGLGGVGEVLIMYGATEAAIAADLGGLIGPSTTVQGFKEHGH